MSEASATALSFSLLALVLLWFIAFELLPDLWADYKRHQDEPTARHANRYPGSFD